MEGFPDYETVDYHIIYAELVRAARQRTTVTYKYLAPLVGLLPTGNYMSDRMGKLLGAISQNEANQHRPMLSALVEKVDGKPGNGFFNFARQLGLLKGDDRQQELAFWEEQKRQIYEIWQQKFPK